MRWWRSTARRCPARPRKLQASNNQIEAAMYELGGIYKEQLKEKQRGYETYAGQVARYPRGEHAPDADYLLYLYYKDLPDPPKAAEYAAALQREFPTSTYAKLIADPRYREHERALHNAVAARLDSAFVLYKDQYFTKAKAVVARTGKAVPEERPQRPGSVFEAAAGHSDAAAGGRARARWRSLPAPTPIARSCRRRRHWRAPSSRLRPGS
ncbi:MAG: hypothetical protein WKG07_21260 [Hymenobacter sp.]